MNSFNLDTNTTPGLSFSQELPKSPLLLLAEVSCLQLGSLRNSVRIVNSSPWSVSLNGQLTNQGTPDSLHPLSSFSISHLPSTENKLVFSEVDPLNKDTQQQMHTETVESKSTESLGCDDRDPLAPGKPQTSQASRLRAAESQAKYAASAKGRATRTRYAASVNGKASKARYNKSNKGRAARARYIETDKCKAAKAKYAASDKGKAAKARYAASDKGRATKARYVATHKGKLTIKDARTNHPISDSEENSGAI